MTNTPLPSTGFPRYRFPCVNGTMKVCDSRRPSHRASFPSLGDTRRRACRFAPCGPGHPTAGQGNEIRSPHPDHNAWRRSGPPRFLESPPVSMPCSRTPADLRARPNTARRHGPRASYYEGSPQVGFRGSIARPRHSLSTLRPVGRPHRTQDSLPAAGQLYRVGFVTHRVPTKGFRSLIPLSQASWRKRCPL
jgi:hypothetical protein